MGRWQRDSPRRRREHREAAQKSTEWLIDVFGKGNVYAELQRHFNREEEARNHAVIEIARRLKLPLLATNGVSYATPRRNARWRTCSPAYAITCDWKLPAVCSRIIRNVS